MKTEFYVDDPGIPGTKARFFEDETGLWYIFRANGKEHVYDSRHDALDDWNTMIAKLKKGA